jgi:hypothetical protein
VPQLLQYISIKYPFLLKEDKNKLGFLRMLLTMGQAGLTNQTPSVLVALEQLTVAQLIMKTSMLGNFTSGPSRSVYKNKLLLQDLRLSKQWLRRVFCSEI